MLVQEALAVYGWEVIVDETTGETTYKNPLTDKVQTEKPDGPLYEKSTESLPEGWVAFIHPDPARDPSEKVFYVNVESGPSRDPMGTSAI